MDSLTCVLFPAPCALCGELLSRMSRVPVCDLCWSSLRPQRGTLCTRCGEDLGVAQFSVPLRPSALRSPSDLLCQPCRVSSPAFEKAEAYGVYEGALRSLIHLLKYEGMRPVARRLGALLAASLELSEELSQEPRSPLLVVPVPMHRAKRRRRGFNHAELLAHAVAGKLRQRHSAWKMRVDSDVLVRKRATEVQAGLTPRQRRENLRGAFFAPHPEKLAGRHVLLIDDVYTTGATARACSRVLLHAGAASIRVATVARAQREGVALWESHFLNDGLAGRQESAVSGGETG